MCCVEDVQHNANDAEAWTQEMNVYVNIQEKKWTEIRGRLRSTGRSEIRKRSKGEYNI